ncbi:MAG TPA: hypothetical protein GX530_10220 [Corynebacteriales bacterium]|nr:hypothetical protein [Mycobacteriales bacterium]
MTSYAEQSERITEIKDQLNKSAEELVEEACYAGPDEWANKVGELIIRMRPGIALSLFAGSGCGTTYLEGQKAIVNNSSLAIFTGSTHFLDDIVWHTSALNPGLLSYNADFLLATHAFIEALNVLFVKNGMSPPPIKTQRVFDDAGLRNVLGARPDRVIEALKQANIEVSECFLP